MSNTKIFNFNAAYTPPIFMEKKRGEFRYLSYGDNNLFPQELINIYNNYSPLHRAVINKKTKMTVGFGYQQITDLNFKNYLDKNNLEKFLLFIGKEFMIHGGFCIEIIWSNDGSTFTYKYIPLHTIRIGLKKDKDEDDYYWYSSNWELFRKDEHKPRYIAKFDPNKRFGRQLYYYTEPNPSVDSEYPISDYSSSLNYISLDHAIGSFHLNQVKQGFSPSMLISFNTGIPTDEEQNEFYNQFVKNYGSDTNSGKVIITYSEGVDQAATLTPIQLNNSDQRFILLQDLVEKNITQGHETPIQLVSAVSGSLGGQEQRAELMAEFNTYYISIKQNQIEECLNNLFSTIGYTEKIKLNDYSTADKSNIITEN